MSGQGLLNVKSRTPQPSGRSSTMWKFSLRGWEQIPEPNWNVQGDATTYYLECESFSGANTFEFGNYAVTLTGWVENRERDAAYFLIIDFGSRLEPIICENFPALLIFLKEIEPILREGWRICDNLEHKEGWNDRIGQIRELAMRLLKND